MSKKERPSWWTPEHVMEKLGEGETIYAVTEKAAELSGISRLTLYSDWRAWLKRDRDLQASYQELMVEKLGRIPKGGPPTKVFTVRRRNRFFEAMARNGGRIARAAREVGVSSGYVYTMIDPKAKDYDHEFAQKVRELEGERYGEIRETVLDSALVDPWLGERVLQSGLPHLHNPKHVVEVEGTIKHQHEHSISQETLQAIAEHRSALNVGREALPAVSEAITLPRAAVRVAEERAS